MATESPHEQQTFVCPECGSQEAAAHTMIEPIHDPADPWTSVFQTETCASCGHNTPTHLGERWNGRSVEDARREWREIYKNPPKD